jgi:hypothetical protein
VIAVSLVVPTVAGELRAGRDAAQQLSPPAVPAVPAVSATTGRADGTTTGSGPGTGSVDGFVLPTDLGPLGRWRADASTTGTSQPPPAAALPPLCSRATAATASGPPRSRTFHGWMADGMAATLTETVTRLTTDETTSVRAALHQAATCRPRSAAGPGTPVRLAGNDTMLVTGERSAAGPMTSASAYVLAGSDWIRLLTRPRDPAITGAPRVAPAGRSSWLIDVAAVAARRLTGAVRPARTAPPAHPSRW